MQPPMLGWKNSYMPCGGMAHICKCLSPFPADPHWYAFRDPISRQPDKETSFGKTYLTRWGSGPSTAKCDQSCWDRYPRSKPIWSHCLSGILTIVSLTSPVIFFIYLVLYWPHFGLNSSYMGFTLLLLHSRYLYLKIYWQYLPFAKILLLSEVLGWWLCLLSFNYSTAGQ